MKESHFIDEDKLIAQAVQILVEKLGAVEATRFLSLPHKIRMESVQRHQQWQSGLNKNQFFDAVFQK